MMSIGNLKLYRRKLKGGRTYICMAASRALADLAIDEQLKIDMTTPEMSSSSLSNPGTPELEQHSSSTPPPTP